MTSNTKTKRIVFLFI